MGFECDFLKGVLLGGAIIMFLCSSMWKQFTLEINERWFRIVKLLKKVKK